MNDQKTNAPATQRTDAHWRGVLTPEQYAVCRRAATERAFTGRYWNHTGAGTYSCVACQAPLFLSVDKFESASGWPSYSRPARPDAVVEHPDASEGMRRVEVKCAHCDSHLGHVFDDGPPPTGLRYCINSAALDFASEPSG